MTLKSTMRNKRTGVRECLQSTERRHSLQSQKVERKDTVHEVLQSTHLYSNKNRTWHEHTVSSISARCAIVPVLCSRRHILLCTKTIRVTDFTSVRTNGSRSERHESAQKVDGIYCRGLLSRLCGHAQPQPRPCGLVTPDTVPISIGATLHEYGLTSILFRVSAAAVLSGQQDVPLRTLTPSESHLLREGTINADRQLLAIALFLGHS
jgi:hypothetical protein